MPVVVTIDAVLLSFLVSLIVAVASLVSRICWFVIGSFIDLFGFLVIP